MTTDKSLASGEEELQRLYEQLTGRQFSYDPGSDPAYRSYADRYTLAGRRAMRDTMGQAAALTGGYSSSYAQSAGQQRYDDYLRSLSEVLPTLYGQALQRYTAEGETLRGAYDMTRQRLNDAYQRDRDALADERYEAEQEQSRQSALYRQQQDNYSKLYKLISTTGYQPTDEELSAAGLSRAQAEALRYEFMRLNKLLPEQQSYYEPVYTGGRSGSSGSSRTNNSQSGSSGGGSGLRLGVGAGISLAGAVAGALANYIRKR